MIIMERHKDGVSTPDPSLSPYTDDNKTVIGSDSSMTSDFSQKYHDDSSFSSWFTLSGITSHSTMKSMNSDDECCTQHNNQKDFTTTMAIQDLQDLQF